MKKYIFLILPIFLVFTINSIAQTPTPAKEQVESILISGATVHLGNGDLVRDGAVGFEDGKITYVGTTRGARDKKFEKIINAEGKHVYPGFIAPNSTIGLQEIGAVRATRDQYEVGTFKPNVRSIIAYQTESEITPTVRTNGVLLGQITPRGGIISGTSSIVQFDAWNWEDAVVRMDDGIHLNWPRIFHLHTKGKKNSIKPRDSYSDTKRRIFHFFNEAKAYAEKDNSSITEVKYAAMKGLFNGTKTLYVHADGAQEITEAVNFKKEMKIANLVIVGGYDAWMVADRLRDNNVGVMLRRVHDLPRYPEDDVDLPYKLAKLLQDENVLFCFENAGDMEQMNSRNIPFLAGTAVAYGLQYEQAVAALTLNAAKLLGIDNEYGSLEIGKSATLFISEGDALDMRTNLISTAWIDGRTLELSNRQIQLYEKYKAMYERKK